MKYRKFKQVCTFILKGPITNKSEDRKLTHVLLWVGYDGLDVFNTWGIEDEGVKTLKGFWKELE